MRYQLNKVKEFQPVISVDNFFTELELDKINEQLKDVKPQAAIAGVTTPITNEDEHTKAVNNSHKIRKSNVYWLESQEYEWLYDKLQVAINHVNLTNYNKVLYGMEALQYTEYDSFYNGFYGPHVDCYMEHDPIIRSLSFSLQLSRDTDYTGGDVLIYTDKGTATANRTYGTITFFDSKILHEVTPVLSGFRKSLVGWILGPRV